VCVQGISLGLNGEGARDGEVVPLSFRASKENVSISWLRTEMVKQMSRECGGG
jgi:hypothetical protein